MIRSHHRSSCLFTLLPFGWQLLHEAKKISRMVSLALSLAGMVIISLISLGQPWMHFQVPLRPPGDPAGSQTFPINTIFFVRCVDISCLREYDQNAYLLDCAWLFILISSLTGFCICITLLNTIFFTSSNLPMLDFSTFIASTLTGMALRSLPRDQVTSMILGVLFYLLQAQEYLQEGMTYRLGRSFYLAWTGILFFLMTGLGLGFGNPRHRTPTPSERPCVSTPAPPLTAQAPLVICVTRARSQNCPQSLHQPRPLLRVQDFV
ncbi:uncharacterized protein PS065_008526 [Dugong dugon]